MSQLKEKIAGEITISDNPGRTIRKWRNMFNASQTKLANEMNIAPSVISDYEQNRRTPGTKLVKKIVTSLIDIDREKGGKIIKRFTPPGQEGIIDMGEFSDAVDLDELIYSIDGECLNGLKQDRKLFGYTIIDSLKAILSMKSFDYLRIYGWSTERILFFTGVEHGRSPMVAIRASPLTPAVVAYVQPEKVDSLSIKLADLEGIPLIKTDYKVKDILEKMEKYMM
ncbi:MAG: helix-turn-helix domain-containing protein [Candidatus Saliniplasma sp.]